LAKDMTENNTIGFLKASPHRIRVLKLLELWHLTIPSELAQQLNISLSQVSRTLAELKESGLVICTTPNRYKGRIYRLTDKGSNLLVFIECDWVE